MCQLLGVSSNKHVDIQLSIQEFHHRGKINPHGWGFAFFQDNKWQVIKKPDKLSKEDVADSRFHFKSNIIIGHVRFITCGSKRYENTHPFNINSWVFAHNGTVNIMNNNGFELRKYQPEGGTDSEHAFCYLLEKIEIFKKVVAIEDSDFTRKELAFAYYHNKDFSKAFSLFMSLGDDAFREAPFVASIVASAKTPEEKQALIERMARLAAAGNKSLWGKIKKLRKEPPETHSDEKNS